jgi:hypothetical protein
MNYDRMTTQSLKALLEGVRTALATDDATSPGQQRPYGARLTPDWRNHGSAIEFVLSMRDEPFERIPW